MRRFLVGARAAGITAVTAVPAVAASAATAPGAASTVKAARYCFTEVARIDPGSPATRVVSQTCSDRAIAGTVLPDSLAGAGRALTAGQVPPGRVSPDGVR